MIYWGAALLLLALSGAPEEAAAPEPVQYAQLTVRQQILIRMPVRLRAGAAAEEEEVDWKEGKRTKCVAVRSVAGATLLERNSVDLILRDRSRIRAKLQSSCPALDYYHGFYISPNPDGQICADRETIRSRMGGECEIDAFRTLKPLKRK